MRIAIIGKNGNLGRELTQVLQGHELFLWDRDEIDATNEQDVLAKLNEAKPEIVFNCAAYTNVDKADEDYASAELLNGHAAGFIAKACKGIGAVVVHFSTGMVFIGTDANGYNEDSVPEPVNAYGKTKLLGEQEVLRNTDNYYLIRTEWLYAKPEYGGKKSFNEIILELAATKPAIQGVEDEVGRPTWAKDLAGAVVDLVLSKHPFGIYHITNSGQASRYEWAKEILKISEIPTPVEPVPGSLFPRPAKRPMYELLNNTKLPELRSWQEALQEYLKEK